jgi:hypothetical protein
MFKFLREKEIIELKNQISRLAMQGRENWALKVQLGNALNEIERLGGDESQIRVPNPVVPLVAYTRDWHVQPNPSGALQFIKQASNFEDELKPFLRANGIAI